MNLAKVMAYYHTNQKDPHMRGPFSFLSHTGLVFSHDPMIINLNRKKKTIYKAEIIDV